MKKMFFLMTVLCFGTTACTTSPTKKIDDSEPPYHAHNFGKMGM